MMLHNAMVNVSVVIGNTLSFVLSRSIKVFDASGPMKGVATIFLFFVCNTHP